MAYLLRGRIQYVDEQYSFALDDFNNAIRLDPSTESFVARALCHLKIGDHGGACGDATRAAAIDPTDPNPIYIRMKAHLERGDSEAAAVSSHIPCLMVRRPLGPRDRQRSPILK